MWSARESGSSFEISSAKIAVHSSKNSLLEAPKAQWAIAIWPRRCDLKSRFENPEPHWCHTEITQEFHNPPKSLAEVACAKEILSSYAMLSFPNQQKCLRVDVVLEKVCFHAKDGSKFIWTPWRSNSRWKKAHVIAPECMSRPVSFFLLLLKNAVVHKQLPKGWRTTLN